MRSAVRLQAGDPGWESRAASFDPPVALCLSGGGLRAALFHLGALRRLDELGLLSRLDAVSCVSGGSIIGGFLATRIESWRSPSGTLFPEQGRWEREIAGPFRELARVGLRPGNPGERIRSSSLLRGGPVDELAGRLGDWFGDRPLSQAPAKPRFIFSATDVTFGCAWIFTHDLMGDHVAGFTRPPESLTIADAVALSCRPPALFDPVPIARMGIHLDAPARDRARGQSADAVRRIELGDGGIADRLALETVWANGGRELDPSQVLLVADGGTPLDPRPADGMNGRLWPRLTAAQETQLRGLHKRWLIERANRGLLHAAFWSVAGSPERYRSDRFEPEIGYRRELVRRSIVTVRTDVDGFSLDEAKVLENHGYNLADSAVRRYAPNLPVGAPLPYNLPHPGHLADGMAERALADSSARRRFGRG